MSLQVSSTSQSHGKAPNGRIGKSVHERMMRHVIIHVMMNNYEKKWNGKFQFSAFNAYTHIHLKLAMQRMPK
jgi:hypothetical protein